MTAPLRATRITPSKPPGIDGLLAAVPPRAKLPAVVRNVRRVTTVVVDPAARVQMLGSAVADDPALSTETLRLANAAVMASAGGGRVDTVHQAILLLGFERVRDVAIGAAVFGMVDGDDPTLAELVGGAVVTAHHALALAAHLRHPRPETAYLTGLLRNLGELAAARWLPEAYRNYRAALGEGLSPTLAARQTLGATRDELGTALARHWGLPDPLRDTLGANDIEFRGPDALLTPIGRLSARLTDAVYRAKPPAETAWDAVYESAERLRIPTATLHDVAEWSFHESVEALKALRPDLNFDAWRGRLDALLGDAAPEGEAQTGARSRPSLVVLRGGADDADADLTPIPADWSYVEPEDPAARAERQTADAVHAALRELLDAGYQRCAFVLLDGSTQSLRVRYADGEGTEYLEQRIDTPFSESTPLGKAFVRGRDLVAPTRLVIAALNDPVLKRLRSVHVAWLPVKVSGTPIGVLFADALRTGVVQDDDSGAAAKMARNELERVLEEIRASGRAPSD